MKKLKPELEKIKNDIKLSHYRFNQLSSFTLFGYWEMDLKNLTVKWSPEAYKIFKIKTQKESHDVDYFLSFIHPSDIGMVSEIIDKALTDFKEYSFFCRLLLKKNEVIHVYIQAKFRFNSKGEPEILYGIIHDITEMKKIQREHCISEMIGQEKERERISKDLHDGVGQMLLATNLNLISIKNSIRKKDTGLAERLAEANISLQNIMQEVRSISHNMSPCILKKQGLSFSINNICETILKKNNISFTFHNTLKKRVNEPDKTTLFRAFQEISTNIIKHSECSKVDVSLFKKYNHIILIVEDNGIGIQKRINVTEQDGIGLISIKNRVELLNGDLKINSQKNKGTRIEISIPC